MSDRVSSFPVAVINPHTMKRGMVPVADHHEVASLMANGWWVMRDVKMHVDEDGFVRADDR